MATSLSALRSTVTATGYPDGPEGDRDGPIPQDLERIIGWIKEGRLRRDLGQLAGWLVVMGHIESVDRVNGYPWRKGEDLMYGLPGASSDASGWKVGNYEPTSWGIHGDVQYVYVLDVVKLEWEVYSPAEFSERLEGRGLYPAIRPRADEDRNFDEAVAEKVNEVNRRILDSVRELEITSSEMKRIVSR